MSDGEVVQTPLEEDATKDSLEVDENEVWEDGESRHLDNGPIDDSDDEADSEKLGEELEKPRRGHFIFPPSIEQAERALCDLTNILKPKWKKGPGYAAPNIDRIIT